MMSRTWLGGLAIGVAGGVLMAAAARPDVAAAQEPNVTLALLSEVHELRLGIERLVALNPQTQIVMARVQRQDEQVARLSAELQMTRTRLADVMAEGDRAQAMLRLVNTRLPRETDIQARSTLEFERENLQVQLQRSQRLQIDLRNRVNDLEVLVSQAEALLADYSGQLTEIERTLRDLWNRVQP
jgi:predicted  nucleic acid-binding Zn-ribbon protein